MRFLFIIFFLTLFIGEGYAANNLPTAGYIEFKKNSGVYFFENTEIFVFDKPAGQKVGVIKAYKKPGVDKISQPYFYSLDKTLTALEAKDPVSCSFIYLDVYKKDGDWLQISAGWIKRADHIDYVSWEDYFASFNAESMGSFPYATKSDQTLLESRPLEGTDPDISPIYNSETNEPVTTKDKNITILINKGAYALVVVSDKSIYRHCQYNVAMEGHVGWIKILNENKQLLVKQLHNCCS